MRLLVVTLLGLIPGLAVAAGGPIVANGPPPMARVDCPPTAAQQVAQRLQEQGHQPKLHRLGELPPASAYAAVLRHVNGCEAPVIIRYDIEESRGEAHE